MEDFDKQSTIVPSDKSETQSAQAPQPKSRRMIDLLPKSLKSQIDRSHSTQNAPEPSQIETPTQNQPAQAQPSQQSQLEGQSQQGQEGRFFSQRKPYSRPHGSHGSHNSHHNSERPDRRHYGNNRNTSDGNQGNENEQVQEFDQSRETIKVSDFRAKSLDDLTRMAEELNINELVGVTKQEITFSILRELSFTNKYNISGDGVLEIMPEGYGFLRAAESNFAPRIDDIYVSPNQIKKFFLRTGEKISGIVKGPKVKEKFFSLYNITSLNDKPFSNIRRLENFDDLVPTYPNKKFMLEVQNDPKGQGQRVIDLICPLGMGQRALIVAPPRSGKTMLMQSIAKSISTNHPESHLIVLLIDERPEEVTEMIRTVKGEVFSSTFDEASFRHVSLAEIVIGKAKRLVESGKDVVILLDNITRLARAYNNVVPSSGKVLSGGVDSNALQGPKKFFGAARNIENGGSLTIIATALIDTGSRMDEVIFEEFKGTGNSEIVLDRKLADRRIFPAIDILKSGTRKEEEMVSEEILSKMWVLRRIIASMGSIEAMEFLLKKIKETKNNSDFFNAMNS